MLFLANDTHCWKAAAKPIEIFICLNKSAEINPIKNSALNRVPLKGLSGMWRDGLFTAGRPQRGHAVFSTLQFQLNKVLLHFQPILTTAFFK